MLLKRLLLALYFVLFTGITTLFSQKLFYPKSEKTCTLKADNSDFDFCYEKTGTIGSFVLTKNTIQYFGLIEDILYNIEKVTVKNSQYTYLCTYNDNKKALITADSKLTKVSVYKNNNKTRYVSIYKSILID